MDAIKEVCEELPIIEDCAQSLFSVYKGKQTGFLSEVSFFSFRSGKYISAGEGSAVFSRNADLLGAIERIVNDFEKHGLFEEILLSGSTYVKSSLYKRPWYGLIGRPVGVRLDKKLNLTAKSGFEVARIRRTDLAVIEQKILTFRAHCAQQRENAHYLLRNLKRDGVVVPAEKTGCISNFYQFALRFESSMHRDFTAENLLRCGIDAAKYLDEVVDLARDQYGYQGGCPNSELCAKSVLSVPNHYTLSKEDLSRIADCLNRAETLWMGSGSNREGAWT